MSFVIGRGRYARSTYPTSPGAGGGASNTPLSRQRFIDGDTGNPGPGAASAPFKTIAAFIASRGDASVQDATANYVGWLMPALNGYTEDVAFPPRVSTELRADSFSIVPGSGASITGNVTWANIGSVPNAASSAAVVMHNVSVIGAITITDDGAAPDEVFFFGGDESGDTSVFLGEFDSSGASRLTAVSFENAIIGDINSGTAANSAIVAAINSQCNGGILAGSFAGINSIIDVNVITVNVGGTVEFINCQFTQGSAPVLTCLQGAVSDSPSWRSFLEAGGTRSAGTIVLVVGGYSGGDVGGFPLPTTGVNTNVSLNGAGATAGYTGSESGNHYFSSGLAANGATVTLKIGGGELNGDTLLITKQDTAAHALAVLNGGTNGGTIGTIPSGGRGFVLAQFSAALGDWVFAEGGSLAA